MRQLASCSRAPQRRLDRRRHVRRAIAEQARQISQAGRRQARTCARPDRSGPARAGRWRPGRPRPADAPPPRRRACRYRAASPATSRDSACRRAAACWRCSSRPSSSSRAHARSADRPRADAPRRAPHEVQNVGRLAPRLGAPGLARLARMHQGQVLARQETVVDQAVLIDRQARVAAFQIAGAVVLDAVAQRQVLRAAPGRGSDRPARSPGGGSPPAAWSG